MSGYGHHARARGAATRRAQGDSTLDQFAELICGGDDPAKALTPRQAAERMGFGPNYGNAMMQRLRKRLGEQAC